ncbi:DUF6470 family protein [Sediminibacillus massiliensis]|uniref:DUF6470 family protein n=1 Tax=Sediminibacillus massiliensis TaxID=1926277 RepID=UPI0009883E01|nr:DUF6470 family protein [Sediminibacillus massiliensis]
MEFPQIRLQSRPAKIGLEMTAAQLTMEQPKAEQSIRQPRAEMNIQRTPSKLSIDQTQAWEDMNMRSVFRLTEHAADLARQDWLEGIARVARQGDELMKIENSGNPIARQANENGFDAPMEFNIGWIPSHGAVKIDYQPSEVNVDIKARRPVIEATPQKPTVNYQPGSVDVNLVQREDLQIDFENLKHHGINFEISI